MSTSRLRASLLLLGTFATAFALQACGGPTSAALGSSSGSAGSGTSAGTGTASGTESGTVSGSGTPVGASDFESAPAPGLNAGSLTAGVGGAVANSAGTAAPQTSATSTAATTRTVQETDLYAFDQTTNHLFYLNSYRGLMVFDLTQVDNPKLLGRYGVFGTPVQMFVTNGLAVVVVADWYGTTVDGQPFHGSIVEGLDATDPTNIKLTGQAPLGGWIQDTRVVGSVLYAVSEDYGWVYGWGAVSTVGTGGGVAVGVGASTSTSTGPNVIVSSVSFAGGVIQQVSSKTFTGYSGIFNVTPNSIMLAHQSPSTDSTIPPPARTDLEYLDISDPGGAIVERGKITVDGNVEGWGADNGRWNLDFADGRTAHVLGCSSSGCGTGYILATVDFTNPDAPVALMPLVIPASGWSPTALFDSLRMYLSPSGAYSPTGNATPLQIYDLSQVSVTTAPSLVGQTSIPGSVWLMIPSGNQLFALGNDDTANASQVSLKYLDVTDPTMPTSIAGSPAEFGNGWAWTPAADTFKAFTHDPTQGLVVLPFSGWDSISGQYNNGVQLIDFTPTSIASDGAAHSKGWVERGIFANGRIISLSDLALSVVNYADRLVPTVTAELTLARNVIASQPAGSTLAEISSDWWGNDQTTSDVRALPISDAAEVHDESSAPDASVPGVDARVFANGLFTYVVTSVQEPALCGTAGGVYAAPGGPGAPQQCYVWQEQITVVDVSGGGAKTRGSVSLPVDPAGWYWSWGWGGFFWDDWYNGGEIVQVGGDALAVRRWHPNYGPQGQYEPASSDLFVVDLSNPDAPSVSSVVITNDWNGWWGDMKVVNNTLYTTHYEWPYGYGPNQHVKYYLDQIDLSDRQNPVVGAKINVPGILVGGSQTDPSILYTIDYRWEVQRNDFDVVKVQGGKAYLQSRTMLDGWVGSVFLSDDGNTAYTSTQLYSYVSDKPNMELHQIDLTNPMLPSDFIASGPKGWGWLLGVNGNRLLVQSGWGDGNGLDVYKLAANAAPTYDQFVRTQGWSISSIARQTTPTSDQLFLSSGDWGVQVVGLK
jgi:hypothetical protein